MEIVVWFEQSGESPGVPFFTRRWRERRYAKVPSHLLKPEREKWSISTEAGETSEP